MTISSSDLSDRRHDASALSAMARSTRHLCCRRVGAPAPPARGRHCCQLRAGRQTVLRSHRRRPGRIDAGDLPLRSRQRVRLRGMRGAACACRHLRSCPRESGMIEHYLEDYQVGQIFGSATARVEGERIKSFAAEFDPQPFHLGEVGQPARSSVALPPAVGTPPRSRCALLVEGRLKPAGGVIGYGLRRAALAAAGAHRRRS